MLFRNILCSYQLKLNNQYYSNIVIDEEVLRTLPENGSFDNQISQLDSEIGAKMGGEIDGKIGSKMSKDGI